MEGRSKRVWKQDSEEQLIELLGADAYTKKIVTITEALRKIDKKVIDQLTYKPPGKLKLAPTTNEEEEFNVINLFESVK